MYSSFQSWFSLSILHLFCLFALTLVLWCWVLCYFAFQYFACQFCLGDFTFQYLVFVHIFLLSLSQKTKFSWSASLCIKSSRFCPNFYHYFSLLSLCRIALKIIAKYIFFVFSGAFLFFLFFFFCVGVFELNSCFGRCLCTWNKNSKYSLDAAVSPMLAINGMPADHNTQTSCLGPKYLVLICHFS